jgi:hypothetical protein
MWWTPCNKWNIDHIYNKNVSIIIVGILTSYSQWTLGSKGLKQRQAIDFGENQWVWMIYYSHDEFSLEMV